MPFFFVLFRIFSYYFHFVFFARPPPSVIRCLFFFSPFFLFSDCFHFVVFVHPLRSSASFFYGICRCRCRSMLDPTASKSLSLWSSWTLSGSPTTRRRAPSPPMPPWSSRACLCRRGRDPWVSLALVSCIIIYLFICNACYILGTRVIFCHLYICRGRGRFL